MTLAIEYQRGRDGAELPSSNAAVPTSSIIPTSPIQSIFDVGVRSKESTQQTASRSREEAQGTARASCSTISPPQSDRDQAIEH